MGFWALQMVLLVAHTHFPHRSLRFPQQDQKHPSGNLGGWQVLFGQIVLPLAGAAIDHGNRVGLGPAPDAPAEAAGQAHQMGVVQRIHRAGQVLPPSAESSRAMPGAKVAIQNDAIDAVVAAREQILIRRA